MDIELDPPITSDELVDVVGNMFPMQLQIAAQELRFSRLAEMYARDHGQEAPKLEVVPDGDDVTES